MNIVLTGSVAFDYLMTFPGYFRDHILPDRLDTISLSFLVDTMVRQRGGVAPNIAYALALLGERPHLMATVGEDFGEYRLWLESVGIDTSATRIIKSEFTASFFVNTDLSNNQIASFYIGAMAHATELSFHNWQGEKPDLVVISPNAPEAMKRYAVECQELSIPYIYDPSQQILRLEGEDLRGGIQGAVALFVNAYEFGLIQNKTGWSIEDVLKQVKFLVITLGEKGSTIYTKTAQYQVPTVTPHQITDPTGGGDAFRGGFLAGYSRGLDLPTCGQMGALAATYCLEQKGTQNYTYTSEQFVARFRENFDDQGKLDVFMKRK
jgi:adenosine kinase